MSGDANKDGEKSLYKEIVWEPNRPPRIGDIAICQHGYMGVIDHITISMEGTKYVGMHIEPTKMGGPWESKDPKIIGNIEDFKKL